MTEDPWTVPEPLTVEVWSDVVCPWCYIGIGTTDAHRLIHMAAALDPRGDEGLQDRT